MGGAIALLLSFSSCGYKFGRGDFIEKYATISVPYVAGDWDGQLTSEIIKKIADKGSIRYVSSGGDLILTVCLFEPDDENIGFTYVIDETGDPDRIIAANEARLTQTASVSVTDACTQRIVLGPVNITSTITYDFDPDFTRFNEQIFSLGQLETHNPAQEAAFRPLYYELAAKIVDFISYSW